MRVFQINTIYNSGSTGRIAADLKHILEANGNECFVAYGRGHSEEANTYCISNKLDMYGHALLTRLTDKTGFYSIRSTKRLIKKIKEVKPDIIHLHNIHGYYLHVDLLFQFLKEYGIPVVWTLHDCWAYTGHCAYYEQYGKYMRCDKWKQQCAECDRTVEYPKSWKDGSQWNYMHKKQAFASLNHLDIVTVSDWMRQQVSESFLNKYSIHTIYNGVDLQRFVPREEELLREKYAIGKKKIVLGVASIWSPLKGLTDIIKLADFLDTEQYQIVLLGIDEEQKKMISQKILALPRTESIEELVAWYNVAEVHFNASKAETFGMTIMESLACGTPVVAYNICAMPELLTPKCGFLVEQAGDVETAAKLITECSKQGMKEACLERSKDFEKNMQYTKYMELYQTVLDRVEK